MKTQINPQETSRAEAFNLWLSSPMPMVTLTKTFNVSNLLKQSKKLNISFNALLCWCIGKAASQIEEFYLLIEKDKLYKYDKIAINVIVNNKKGGINSCDIAFNEDLTQFVKDYTQLTQRTSQENKSNFLEDYMIIGTSAMIETELDSIVNQYTDKFTNPMLMWGKYRKQLFKTLLPISFQFHHSQMDGGHGAKFLELLQKEIKKA
ncbi:MAG: CatA-like O-acetyltransferase, family 2 [Bacteroidales bacterium]|nr:CatA-like O-acetyltransferase, family 2 [Bacteroidales bacterium]MEE1226772.1 CatA-like O-acetyltransferase, family 2 [Bacteroidales bacterium]